MADYHYLESFKVKSPALKNEVGRGNIFLPVEKHEIIELEGYLDVALPSDLKAFYNQIGYGFLTHSLSTPGEDIFFGSNRINDPVTILEMLQKGGESGLISEQTHSLLKPGDIPVFEIADSSSFMIMKPLSDNPNAVYTDTQIKIEDSFERFVWRLYHEDVAYYDKIVDDYYLKEKGVDLNQLRYGNTDESE